MLIEDQNIYFVENIISISDSKENTDSYVAALLKVSEKFNLNSENDNLDFSFVELNRKQINNFHEGQYVYQRNNILSNANSTPFAKRNIYFNNLYRGRLIKRSVTPNESNNSYRDSNVYSYHVNVGHGNCSILVMEQNNLTSIWLIDCSNFDMINKKDYQPNIDKCLEHIKTRFSLDKVLFNKCFITHTHFDHYSGIGKMIDKGLISKKTEIYLNLHYSMPGENLTKLLKKISKIKAKVVEPISINSNENIEIWYPLKRTIRTKTAKYKGQNIEIESRPNNSSAVFHFTFDSKSILFTGDIETAGWNKIEKCCGHLQNSDYFTISHHGSINGHLRTKCPAEMSISNLSNCVLRDSTQILMGRDNAFKGIYSDQVINDFKNIVRTEKDFLGNDAKFLEIDWQTNSKNHII